VTPSTFCASWLNYGGVAMEIRSIREFRDGLNFRKNNVNLVMDDSMEDFEDK
jgi:hypothetical protein